VLSELSLTARRFEPLCWQAYKCRPETRPTTWLFDNTRKRSHCKVFPV